jgi:cytidine deaminase
MKEITIASTLLVAEHIRELGETDKMLLLRAKEAAKDAYAPYSNFKVGSAVLLENGHVFIGNNQENAAYPSTMCGERNAIFAAAANYPKVPIKSVAITVISANKGVDKPVPPCGACRQVIYENECRHQNNIRIILQGDSGAIYLIKSVKDILPIHFDASYL